MTALVEVTESPLDPAALADAVRRPGAGALCEFHGVVRDTNLDRAVDHLVYEAFDDLAVRAMQSLADDVTAKWPEARIAMAHRTGRLEIGEASVCIAVSSPHRAEAFEACRYAIDTLKATVPIWKKEVWADGEAWIEGVPPAPLES